MTYINLPTDSKVINELDRTFGFCFRDGHCEFCKQEQLEICREIHPEWFTKKNKEISSKHIFKVYDFVKVPLVKCLCLATDAQDRVEELCICNSHLHRLKEMFDRG